MNGVGIGYLGRADHGRNVEIAARAFGGTDADGLVGKSHVQAVAVGLRIHSHRLDAQILAGTDDTNGDFAPIGDEDFLEHVSLGKLQVNAGEWRTEPRRTPLACRSPSAWPRRFR